MSDDYAQELPITALTARVVSMYVQYNRLPLDQVAGLIAEVHSALDGLRQPLEPAAAIIELVPAVPVRKSVHNDYLVSLEDGRKFKSLRRHLRTSYGMTPEEYRAKWGLPADYPMVAPGYAAKRSEMAKSIGLGQRKAERIEAEPAVVAKPAKTKRKSGKAKAS